jgi:hypothetical protein
MDSAEDPFTFSFVLEKLLSEKLKFGVNGCELEVSGVTDPECIFVSK